MLTSASGCTEEPRACTDLRALDGLGLLLRGEVAPGAYRLQVDADGDPLETRFDISEGYGTCKGDCDTASSIHTMRTLGSPGIIRLSVTRSSDLGGPRIARVRVLRDDVEVFARELRPVYVESEPNGEGCGVHTSASVMLPFP